ncbi:MAG: CoA ester lyase [Betaproteobacteria bacterium]|nr:CoA ester lyase [Betaproteobacteria bacterium]
MTPSPHPQDALFDPGEPAATALPVCDHYAGVEVRMRKSLELQSELGPVFDITLDAEDGAPVGGEMDHVELMVELINGPTNRYGRVGARVKPVDHPLFADLVDLIVKKAGARLPYLMIPKVRGVADVDRAAAAVDHACQRHGIDRVIPLHTLAETHGALRQIDAIAAHARVQSISFGLMDFVSAHRGAIPQSAMSVHGQFEHPLVVRAKLDIAAACHAHGKTPSHCVVTEFKDTQALAAAANKAIRILGYTRMWSIHPAQIQPIVDAFAPTVAEVDHAVEILLQAQDAQWAPIRHQDTLHDRASYRYFWHVLERAHGTGQPLPAEVTRRFFSP